MLAADKGLRVVDVKRQNLLRRYTSLQIAMQTTKWIDTLEKPTLTVLPTVEINTEAMRQNFNRILAAQRHKDYIFREKRAAGDVLYCTFEELQEGFTAAMAKIQAFAEAPVLDLVPQTAKRENRALREIITNYEQVVEFFEKEAPEWSWMLKE